MRRVFVFATVAAVALAMGMGGGPVSAQEANDTTTNATVGNYTADYEEIIDSKTRILEWSFDEGVFTVEIEADEPTTAAVAESGSFEKGAGQFTYQELSIPEGQSTHTIRVRDPEGAALTFGTALSQEEERGAYISTGRETESNPFESFGGESGLFTGVGMTVVLAALGAWWVVRSEENGVIEA